MSSKPGFPDSNATDPATETAPVPQSYKHGWPDTTDRDRATQDTIDKFRELHPDATIISAEIVYTEAHKEAGEFLVKLLAL